MPVIDSGTVTGTGAGTFTDSSKTWTASEHITRILKNTTTNKSGAITANTADTITTKVSFTTNDTYQILELSTQEEDFEPRKQIYLEDEVLGLKPDGPKADFSIDG